MHLAEIPFGESIEREGEGGNHICLHKSYLIALNCVSFTGADEYSMKGWRARSGETFCSQRARPAASKGGFCRHDKTSPAAAAAPRCFILCEGGLCVACSSFMKEVKGRYLGALLVILAPHQGPIILWKRRKHIRRRRWRNPVRTFIRWSRPSSPLTALPSPAGGHVSKTSAGTSLWSGSAERRDLRGAFGSLR